MAGNRTRFNKTFTLRRNTPHRRINLKILKNAAIVDSGNKQAVRTYREIEVTGAINARW